MIDRKELRIGNLIVLAHESNAPIAEVLELHKRYAIVRITPTQLENRPIYENIMPIKLTEEWLEILGFTKLHGDRWTLQYEIDIEKIGNAGYFILCEEQTNWRKSYSHVHEIQNISYWLTGKELTIKEPINER